MGLDAGADGAQQVQIAANRKCFAGGDVQAGHGDRTFAARSRFLGENRQRDAADAALAGVAQGEGHAHVNRIRAAAHGGGRTAPFVSGQRDRSVVREIDFVGQILLLAELGEGQRRLAPSKQENSIAHTRP